MQFDTPDQKAFFADLLVQAQYQGGAVLFVAEQMRAVEHAEVASEIEAARAADDLNEQRNRNRDESNGLPLE